MNWGNQLVMCAWFICGLLLIIKAISIGRLGLKDGFVYSIIASIFIFILGPPILFITWICEFMDHNP